MINLMLTAYSERIFVEVRSRRGAEYGTPEESLTRAKIRHLTAASLDYLQRHGGKVPSWRIDFIGVRFGQDYQLESIDHLPHAVEL